VDALDVLRAFWTAMCEWERRAVRLARAARPAILDVAPLAAERDAIIETYCTPKRRVFSKSVGFGDPPEYDPDNEWVLEVVAETPRRVVIHTQQVGGFQQRRRYAVLRRGDRWLLDGWQSLSGEKWVRGII
jgi:hypothetical protein